MPGHIKDITAEGISHVKLIDATPIGINVRSTIATYANVHDELRKIFAATADAKAESSKQANFPIIQAVCGALYATERELSALMFSFCPM